MKPRRPSPLQSLREQLSLAPDRGVHVLLQHVAISPFPFRGPLISILQKWFVRTFQKNPGRRLSNFATLLQPPAQISVIVTLFLLFELKGLKDKTTYANH
mmetsp:Transcript_41365/g.81113  ORF Transcript_41365/g.81113 Transcript_41365/m.81113 type:complete len:100 (-) Transcript_41365:215-514(-)